MGYDLDDLHGSENPAPQEATTDAPRPETAEVCQNCGHRNCEWGAPGLSAPCQCCKSLCNPATQLATTEGERAYRIRSNDDGAWVVDDPTFGPEAVFQAKAEAEAFVLGHAAGVGREREMVFRYCPACGCERADFEGYPDRFLPQCPNWNKAAEEVRTFKSRPVEEKRP